MNSQLIIAPRFQECRLEFNNIDYNCRKYSNYFYYDACNLGMDKRLRDNRASLPPKKSTILTCTASRIDQCRTFVFPKLFV